MNGTVGNPACLSPHEAIHVKALQKHYGSTWAVRGIDFSVYSGEIFGLIGPDGAGKTTTFQILAGVLAPTAGTIEILGRPPREARLGIGYLTQQFSLYLDLSVDENLRYVAGLRQVPPGQFEQRRSHYLSLVGLDRFGDRLAGQLSGGMRQKLALCCALIANPQILLLDEPTTGVDPVSRREFWDVIASLASQGVTVVVATPYLDEAERCSRIALIADGQIQQTGTLSELRSRLGLHRLEVWARPLASAEQVLLTAIADSSQSLSHEPNPHIVDVQTFGDRLDVLVSSVAAAKQQVRSLFQQHQIQLDQIQAAEPTLENVFVNQLRQQGAEPPFVPLPRSQEPQDGLLPSSSSDRTVAIGTQQIQKNFGSFQAVKAVTLTIHYGEIYGLLGANGAGKTTTIKMLCGLLEPSAGQITLAGQTQNLRSPALRRRIGYMSQKFTLYDDLTIRQNLEFYCGVYGVPRQQRTDKINWVLKICGLEDQANLLTGRLPGGWKQRVALGASVMHEPEILFLDEPTSGVDPLARRQFWRLIEDFARQGTAVLVTTHYLEEAEHCHALGFMVAGSIVAQGSPSQIKAAQPGQLIELAIAHPQQAADLLKAELDPWRVSFFGDRIHLVLDQPDQELPRLRQRLQAVQSPQGQPLQIQSMRPIPFSLEDAFIGIVQRSQEGR